MEKKEKNKEFLIIITGHGYEKLNIEKKILSSINALIFDADKGSKDEFLEQIKLADGLIVGDTNIDKKIIDIMENCKVISEYGIGVDNIDVKAATNRKIAVLNVPGYGTGEVADQAMTLILTLARKIYLLTNLTKLKGWSYARKKAKSIYRLKGKVLGIIGFGRIGQAVAERAKSFGFKILVFDPYQNLYNLKNDYSISTTERIFKESDFISFHCPLTEETVNLLNEERFKLMKKTAYVINTARGAIIDEKALLKALESKWIAGAALDVVSDFEFTEDNVLYNYFLNHDNLIIVPHTAWYSEESDIELRTGATKGVIDILLGKEPESQVN